MFCKHKWEIVDKTILPSAFEQVKGEIDVKAGPLWVFTKKYICILKCSKCGKLNTITNQNP